MFINPKFYFRSGAILYWPHLLCLSGLPSCWTVEVVLTLTCEEDLHQQAEVRFEHGDSPELRKELCWET